MRGFMPGAIVKNITPGSNDPAILPCGVDLHVAVSRSDSLHDWFDGPSGGVEAHFYVRFDGTIEQYRSIFFEADAQFEGNSFMLGDHRVGFISVETEGMGSGRWTKAQLESIKAIILWVHSQQAFPMRVCPAWNSRGVGYHSLFEEWNTNHHSCPGPARIEQFHDVIEPWLPDALRGPKDSRGGHVDEAIHDLRVAKRHQPRHRAALAAALKLLRSIPLFTWRK
jgi:hypothetical protein